MNYSISLVTIEAAMAVVPLWLPTVRGEQDLLV